MNHPRRVVLGLLLVAGCAHGAAGLTSPSTAASPIPANQPAQTLWAGAARVELTPPAGTPLAGYSRRHGRASLGAHEPLYARALAFSDGRRVVILVSCETLIIDEELHRAALQRVQQRYRVDRADLLLWSTHTHSGPGGYGRRFLEQLSMGRYDARVFEILSQRIAEASVRAVGRLAPASVRGGEAIVEGASRNRLHAGGPTDPVVRVLRVDGAGATPVAFLVTFAAHPTVLGAENRRFSGDYPGALMAAIEQQHPGSVCLFAAGAIADQAPARGPGDRFLEAQQLGERLAKAALSASEQEPSSVTSAGLGTAIAEVSLPPARLRWGHARLPAWFSERFFDRYAQLHLVAIDGRLLIGAPCDLSLEVGRRLSDAARSRGWRPLVIGFADDYIGYVLPPADYAGDSYEAHMSFNGPTVADVLTRALTTMMDHVTLPSDHATSAP